MSENATACCVEELARSATVRLEAAGPDEGRTAGEALLDHRITTASLRPEPRR
jgi:hypothetical protein